MVISAEELDRIEEHIRLHGDSDVHVSNDERIELNWAIKAGKYAESYERLILSIPLASLHFSQVDEAMYLAFRHQFPDLDVTVLDTAFLERSEVLAQFRTLVQLFQSLPSAKLLTILRVDAMRPAGPENSMLVPRIQFYMVELARLREGVTARFIEAEKLRAAAAPEGGEEHAPEAE